LQQANLKLPILRFARNVLAVTVADGSHLGGFAWELVAFKAEFNAFVVGAVADFAELVFPCNAADAAVGACATLHSGAFLAGNAANTNFHT
jgi:hypothetical protein